MTTNVNKFQGQVAGYFRQLILATAYLDIGSRSLAGAANDVSVALTLAHDVTTEPMFLRELRPYSTEVAQGISELFQTKTIAAWSDLLNDLFAHHVTAHLEGRKLSPELKKRNTRIDFSSESDIASQLRDGLIADFSFEKYSERIKMINRMLDPDGGCQAELSIIKKHVLIRNSIQHHGGRVYEDMLKELGNQQIDVFGHDGNPMSMGVGSSVKLFVPELDHLKGAMFRLTNHWRNRLA